MPASLLVPDLNLSSEVNSTKFISELCLSETAEDCAFSLSSGADGSQVVATKNHIQCWGYYWLTAAWQQHIVDAEHHLFSLLDRSFRQGDVNCHLVTIKISIEGSTYQGMELDGATINEHWFEGLHAKSVQGGSPVKQHWALLDNLLQYVIYLWISPLH
ncbi:hypothetical protein ES703_83308 [subsurface metagenome]